MVVLLHEVFPAGFGFLILGWPIYAYGLSISALRKAFKDYESSAVLTPSFLVLLPSIFLTWILFTEADASDAFIIWLIFVAAPLFMSATAAFVRLFTKN